MLVNLMSPGLAIQNILRASVALSATIIFAGCSSSIPETDSNPPARVEPSTNSDSSRALGYCDSPFNTTATKSLHELMYAPADAGLKVVKLKSPAKFSNDQEMLNLSAGCLAPTDSGCKAQGYLGLHTDSLPLRISKGQITYLRAEDAAKFDSITFADIDSLDLKALDGDAVTKVNLFSRPVGMSENSMVGNTPFGKGTTALILLDDPFQSGKYHLYKIRVEEFQKYDHALLSYQLIAKADDETVRDFICSRRAVLEAIGSKEIGETTMAPNENTFFDFLTGLDAVDRHFIGRDWDGQISFDTRGSTSNPTGATGRVLNWKNYFGRITNIGDKVLAEISRDSWNSINPPYGWSTGAADMQLTANTTYLLAHTNHRRSLFVAFQVLKVDASGMHIKWKRFAEEPPVRTMNFVSQVIKPEPSYRLVTWNEGRGTEYSEDRFRIGFFAIDNDVRFDAKSGLFTTNGRIFPDHSGIVDVTSNYASLDVIPQSADASLTGSYKASEPVRMGARYVLVSENYEKRSVAIFEVVGFVPGKAVTVKYKQQAVYIPEPIKIK